MNRIASIVATVAALVTVSPAAQAQLVRLDYFSAAQGTQPAVEYSVTLDGSTGQRPNFGPGPSFANVATHGILKINGVTVLDATGTSAPMIETDEGYQFDRVNALGVDASFASTLGGPNTNYVPSDLSQTTPSDIHLYLTPGTYTPNPGQFDVPSYIRYNTLDAPLTTLTVTAVPEPTTLGLITLGGTMLLRRGRRRT